MSFCAVDYDGNYDNIASFLKEKVATCEVSKSNNNKILVKLTNSDEKDELMFFSNFTTDDQISNIFKVKKQYKFIKLYKNIQIVEISEQEYNNLNTPISNNADSSQETIKDNIDRALNGDLAVSTIIEDTNNIGKLSNTTSLNDIKIGFGVESSGNLNEITKNTQYPLGKKSDDERFERLLSMNYIVQFLAFSSIVIFFIALTN